MVERTITTVFKVGDNFVAEITPAFDSLPNVGTVLKTSSGTAVVVSYPMAPHPEFATDILLSGDVRVNDVVSIQDDHAIGARLTSIEQLKMSLNANYDTRFWYNDLLWYIAPFYDDGTWLIYANRTDWDSEPVFVYEHVLDGWQFDFGEGKTLIDIWQDIEPYDMFY
ncbi:MAG TPA: hypothetical protein VGM95_02420 [Lactobacillaceae bacterium]